MDATRLKSIALFEEVGDEELAEIAPFATEVSVEEGRELVREGDFSYEFMAIEEGEAEVTRGGEHVADLGPGDFFGEMGLLERTLRNATVTAKTPVRLVTLTGWDLKRVERSAPAGHGADPLRARGAPPGGLSGAARIVLFGATGYTGRLAAEAMVERGMRPVLAARGRDALEALAAELGGLETAVADVSDPASVRALIERATCCVTTVGPFARWGAPAAAAASSVGRPLHRLDRRAGVHPLRSSSATGRPPSRSGSAMLTAFGYDWVPGNLAGGLALERAGDAAVRVDIGYFIDRQGGDERRHDGVDRRARVAANRASPSATGACRPSAAPSGCASFQRRRRSKRDGVSVGSSEHFALPRVAPQLREVNAYLGWFGPLSRPMQVMSLGTTAARGAADLVKAVGRRFVKGSTGGPDAEARSRSGSQIVAIAYDSAGTRAGPRCTDRASTATRSPGRILAWGAQQRRRGRR